jgi:hypothetical protein
MLLALRALAGLTDAPFGAARASPYLDLLMAAAPARQWVLADYASRERASR